MNCPNCGKQVANGARFCNHCGQPLGNAEKTTQTVETIPIPGEGRASYTHSATAQGGVPHNAPGRAPHAPHPGSGGPSDPRASSVPPSGSPKSSSGSRKGARTAIVVVVAVLTLLMATCTAFCVGSTLSVSEHLKSTKYPVTFTISITSEYDSTSSRIPVEITGRDANGNDVNETVFLAYSGVDIELPEGKYQAKAVGSPIASNGTIYKIPSRAIEFEVSPKNNSSKNDGVTVRSVLTFTPIAPKDMTDEQIEDAIAWARKDEESNAEVGKLEKAVEQRKNKGSTDPNTESNSNKEDTSKETNRDTKNDTSKDTKKN